MAATPVPITGANTIVGYNVSTPFTITDEYTFSFPYLSQDDFEIEVNSTTILDAADYTFTTDYLINLTTVGRDKLNALYTTGTIPVVLRRRTQLTSRQVDFQDGATLTADELDLNSNQAFYLVQEVYDATNLTASINPVSGSIDFEGAEIIDIAEPTTLTSGATLTTVLANAITPLYTTGDQYRSGRMVFNAAGDLIRANKDILDGAVFGAPAVLVGADWVDVLTAAQIAQIADHETRIGTIETNQVTKVGTPVDNQIGIFTGDGTLEGDANLTYDSSLGHLEFTGEMDIIHVATGTDEHALEICVDADANGDVKAIDIDYTTGATVTGQDEAVILVNIDESLATGGDITALEVLATEGAAQVNGMLLGAGVHPIEQLSGVFSDMDSALVNATDRLAEFISSASDIVMFVADNDTVTIGNAAKFEEIEFLLDTVSSKNIQPTFEFSTGIGTWTTFTPTDGTNGMLNNGVIAWLDGDIPTWATGLAGEFLIRITRTRNGSITSPIEDKVQIVVAAEYSWDENADVTINGLVVGADLSVTKTTDATLEVKGTDGAFMPPTLTTTQRDALTPTAGFQIYNSTNERPEGYFGSQWQGLASSGGGSLDSFLSEDFEITSSSDFTQGLLADPIAAGGGTFGGTLSDDTSTNLSGDTSLKYVAGVTSTNDFFIIDTDIPVDVKQRDNYMGVTFYYKYDGSDDDIKLIILDQDDNMLSDSLDVLKSKTTATRFSTSFFVPSGTTGLRYGFQVVTGVNTKILIVDDIEISTDPFVYKDLIETTEWADYTPTLTAFGDGSAEGRWRRQGDYMEVEVYLQVGATTIPTGAYSFSLPSGYTLDTAKYLGEGRGFGVCQYFNASSGASFSGTIAELTSSTFNFQDGSGTYYWNGSSPQVPPLINGKVYGRMRVPISGWVESTEHVVTPASVKPEAIEYHGYTSTDGSDRILYATERSDTSGNLLSVTNSGYTKITALKDCYYIVTGGAAFASQGNWFQVFHRDSAGTQLKSAYSDDPDYVYGAGGSICGFAAAGDYFHTGATYAVGGMDNNTGSNFSVTAFPTEATFLAAIPKQTQTQITLAADFSNNSGTWATPNAAFKIDVVAGGRYILNLKGLSQVLTSSSAIGNMLTVEYVFSSSSTAGVGFIGATAVLHAHCYATNNWSYEFLDFTSESIYEPTVSGSVYVQVRKRGFSGSPTTTAIGLRSESGSGNGYDPILTATKIV